MNQFGERIRELRLQHNIRQRQIAALLEADTAFVSKMEKGTRQPKREQVIAIAQLLNADKEELITLWLADQLYDVIDGEPMAKEALKTLSQKIKTSK